VGALISVGVSVSSTLVRFPLPINSYTEPTSITVVGTFNVININTGTVIATGVTPTIISPSSNKIALVQVSVSATGLVAGVNCALYPDSATSKITVNF
jgi:hypothetical protein